jgi:hypothetical protein
VGSGERKGGVSWGRSLRRVGVEFRRLLTTLVNLWVLMVRSREGGGVDNRVGELRDKTGMVFWWPVRCVLTRVLPTAAEEKRRQ